MKKIDSTGYLDSLYGEPIAAAVKKVQPRITPRYREWISASRFLMLATVGTAGTDVSPRGDTQAVLEIIDDRTLMLPDWRGNNRLDSLRNIVEDGRVSVLLMVPGCNNVVRINGAAIVTDDEKATLKFSQRGKHPRTVIVISVHEVYFQCAKALMRSGLWTADDESDRVPTAGEFIAEFDAGFDSKSYDVGYADYARERLW